MFKCSHFKHTIRVLHIQKYLIYVLCMMGEGELGITEMLGAVFAIQSSSMAGWNILYTRSLQDSF